MQQFPSPNDDNKSRGTAEDKRCTPINEEKFHDKKKKYKVNSFT